MIGLIDDIFWAVRMFHARRWRRMLSFSQRITFDDTVRHQLDDEVVAYPDAFYHTDDADISRAMHAIPTPLYDSSGNLAKCRRT